MGFLIKIFIIYRFIIKIFIIFAVSQNILSMTKTDFIAYQRTLITKDRLFTVFQFKEGKYLINFRTFNN